MGGQRIVTVVELYFNCTSFACDHTCCLQLCFDGFYSQLIIIVLPRHCFAHSKNSLMRVKENTHLFFSTKLITFEWHSSQCPDWDSKVTFITNDGCWMETNLRWDLSCVWQWVLRVELLIVSFHLLTLSMIDQIK